MEQNHLPGNVMRKSWSKRIHKIYLNQTVNETIFRLNKFENSSKPLPVFPETYVKLSHVSKPPRIAFSVTNDFLQLCFCRYCDSFKTIIWYNTCKRPPRWQKITPFVFLTLRNSAERLTNQCLFK